MEDTKPVITEKCEPVNLGDFLPGGMVGNTVHDNQIGSHYPLPAQEETHSAAVRYVLKTGVLDSEAPCSGMVVDIGGNCGFCRAYIPGSSADMIWFGWEVAGCPKGRVRYPFEGNSWYAMEQGRLRITEGSDAGKDYLYLKINGETVSAFVGEPDSHPRSGQKVYIEASGAMRIMGDRELPDLIRDIKSGKFRFGRKKKGNNKDNSESINLDKSRTGRRTGDGR